MGSSQDHSLVVCLQRERLCPGKYFLSACIDRPVAVIKYAEDSALQCGAPQGPALICLQIKLACLHSAEYQFIFTSDGHDLCK